MAHPLRYRDDDPLLTRLRELVLALPEAAEKVSHGRPSFYTVKVFAMFGGVVEERPLRRRLCPVGRLPPRRGRAGGPARRHPVLRAGLCGAFGWIGLNLAVGEVDWTEVRELVEMSYRNTAPARLVRLLDAP